MLDPESLKALLLDLCAVSARETLPRFRYLNTVENKLTVGFDPVTEADKAAETAIRARIMEAFPDHGIAGEEEEDYQRDAEYCWVIDPIDGTRAFISGLPGWGTLIGLTHKSIPLAGAMHQPFTGETWLADGQRSLFIRDKQEVPIQTSATSDPATATMMTTDPFLFEAEEWETFNRMRSACRLTRYGFDCYAYAMVASGHIDMVMESGLNAYDIAPLVPIIEQAGGVVTTWTGGSPANGGQILASANPKLHEKAMALLARS